jgi:signal transduction histidine kinase
MTRDNDFYDELSRINNELANLQRALAQKNAELEQLNQLKNRFLGMAMHDLRNPIQAIMAFSAGLMEDTSPELPDDQAHMLQRIHALSEFMARVVNDFLDVALIESGQLRLMRASVELPQLIQHVMEISSIKATKKSITIEVLEDPAVPALHLDAAKIEQALLNLVSNAIEHSHSGSTVTVRSRWMRAERQLRVDVEDRGVGISDHDLTRLFDPLARKSSRKTNGEQGTGLGLAITQKIVEAHGGTVAATSVEGKGSVFHVSLPISSADDTRA